MNAKQKRNAIILGVLGLLAAFFLLKPFLMESDFDRQYRENQEKAAKEKAAGVVPGAADAAPAAAAGAPVPTNGAAVKSQFQKASVNVDQLIASIKEVSFDYETSRTQRNPMTPLVGESAKATIATAQGATPQGTPAVAISGGDAQGVLRSFKVTGILWDKHDPMAVVSYPLNGQLTSEVVTRGFKFGDLGIVVNDIEMERVILNVNGTLVSLQLEER